MSQTEKTPTTKQPWFEADTTSITLKTLPDMMAVAQTPQFGETESENLCSFLMCEAFESRYNPSNARALKLAAMIISRVAAEDSWRALALQFDRHRMAAMGHLRTLLFCPEGHKLAAWDFLAAAPETDPAVLEQKMKEYIERTYPK